MGTEKYDLIKVTSFPNKLENVLYNFIVPAYEFLGMDSFRERYISFSITELESCYDLRHSSPHQELICMQSSPIFEVAASRDDCGVTLLTKETTTKCDQRFSNISSELWIQLRTENSWIGIFPRQQTLYIRCNDLPTMKKVVNGTGIIKLQQD